MFYIDLEKFLVSEDTTDIEWKEVKIQNKDLIRRWGHASSVKGDKAYIFGGRYSNKDLQNFVEVDLITEKCSAIKLESSVKGRRKPGLCFKNNTMFLFSGFDGSYLKDFLFVDLTSRPSYKKSHKNYEFFEGLKKQFSCYQPEELDYKFDNNVINIELSEI